MSSDVVSPVFCMVIFQRAMICLMSVSDGHSVALRLTRTSPFISSFILGFTFFMFLFLFHHRFSPSLANPDGLTDAHYQHSQQERETD